MASSPISLQSCLSLVSLMGRESSRLRLTLPSGDPDQLEFRLDSLLGQSTAVLRRILQFDICCLSCRGKQRHITLCVSPLQKKAHMDLPCGDTFCRFTMEEPLSHDGKFTFSTGACGLQHPRSLEIFPM